MCYNPQVPILLYSTALVSVSSAEVRNEGWGCGGRMSVIELEEEVEQHAVTKTEGIEEWNRMHSSVEKVRWKPDYRILKYKYNDAFRGKPSD